MKVAFVVPCRNKARWVRDAARSVLAQTFSPMDIVFSDQGSTDQSLSIMKAVAESYNGPNKVWVVQCPETERRGTAGYNAHLNWLHKHVEADVFIQMSADDAAEPTRAERSVAAFRETGCDYVGGQVIFHDETGAETRRTYPGLGSCMVPVDALVAERFGGKCSSAWTRDLFDFHGPLSEVSCQDLMLPFCAALRKGFHYQAEPLQHYFNRPDPENLGLEGLLRLATSPQAEAQVVESMNYLMAVNVTLMIAPIERLMTADAEASRPENPTLRQAIDSLYRQYMQQTMDWLGCRNALTLMGVAPMRFPI